MNFVVRVRCRRKESSRSLSHLLIISCFSLHCQNSLSPKSGVSEFLKCTLQFCWSLFDFCVLYFTTKALVNFVLEELKISLKSSLSTQSLCHLLSPRLGVPQKQGLRIPAYRPISCSILKPESLGGPISHFVLTRKS